MELTRPLTGETSTRRDFIRTRTIGAAALSSITLGAFAYRPVKEAYSKFQLIGHDYSNYPFLEAVDSRYIDHARLSELLSDAPDKVLDSERTSKNFQANPENLAEFTFVVDKPGPIHVQFEGLAGDDVDLVVLKISVDGDGEEFYAPIIRGPSQETPPEIQLGVHTDGEHRLDISVAGLNPAVTPSEITPRFVRGEPDTLRSHIDMHQPDIYLRNYGNIAHNIPLRSAAFVHETNDALAVIYWTECLGEDLVYGRFGTSVEQLIATKNRPTDFDWTLEALIDKRSGALLLANIAEPYHNRRKYEIDPSYISHPPLREASENNNVTPVTDEDKAVLLLPKFRPRPKTYVHDDRKIVLYSTGKDTSTLSLREHNKRGNLDLSSTEIINYLGTLGLDLANLKD